MKKMLLPAEVSFRRLHRRVPEEHLDLLQLAAGRPAQLRARAAKIVRRDACNAHLSRIMPEHLPDDRFGEALASNGAHTGIKPITNPGSAYR